MLWLTKQGYLEVFRVYPTILQYPSIAELWDEHGKIAVGVREAAFICGDTADWCHGSTSLSVHAKHCVFDVLALEKLGHGRLIILSPHIEMWAISILTC